MSSAKIQVKSQRERLFSAAYSHFVHISKILLLLAIFGILIFVVIVPLLGYKQDTDIVLEFGTVESKEDTPPVMQKPRFQGVDKENRPYLVTADTAVQTSESTIMLENVEADVTTEKGNWLALLAEQGIMEMEEHSLFLQGNVQLYHDAGHEMRTEEVRIDLNQLEAYGNLPIQIQGEFGHIKADRFTILDKGNRMLFKKNVYVMLLP